MADSAATPTISDFSLLPAAKLLVMDFPRIFLRRLLMKEQDYFRLQSSETTIALVAAQILSSYISAGKVTDQNESNMLDKSISLAISLARKVEDLVESDSEKKE